MKTTQLEMFAETVKFVRVAFVSEGGPVAYAKSPEDIATIYKRDVASRPEYDPEVEQFTVILLDTRNTVKAAHIVSKGTLNSSIVHAREVFRTAIACNAAAVILAHNHPSGNTSPSPEDLKVTRDLIAAGKVIGIRVMDHVIINDGPDLAGQFKNFLSLRESGLVSFEGGF
jgi:DNA repair protein RadC